MEADLEELRERVPGIGLKRSAKDYCEQWRQGGYLVRRPVVDTRQETYELSGGALAAIAFADGIARPRRAATKSRLNLIIEQISDLSLDTDPDVTRRRAMLLAERQRIDESLKALDRGEVEIIKTEQAVEQVREILSLGQEIPRDFVNVSAEFEEIAKTLFAKLIGYDEESRNTLEDVFEGVDHIAQSPSGRSFEGFYALLRDAEASERLQDDIDAILRADFADGLDADERRFLREFATTLLEQGRDVNATKTGLARGLRRLVLSQSFRQDRELKRLIDRSLFQASRLSETHRCSSLLSFRLDLTKTAIEPISRLELRNPADPAALMGSTPFMENFTITLEEIIRQVRETEIDFVELASNVNAYFKQADADKQVDISIGTVLDQFPATQGVASVSGLRVLAAAQGSRSASTEVVRWSSTGGSKRRATIDRLAFIEEVHA